MLCALSVSISTLGRLKELPPGQRSPGEHGGVLAVKPPVDGVHASRQLLYLRCVISSCVVGCKMGSNQGRRSRDWCILDAITIPSGKPNFIALSLAGNGGPFSVSQIIEPLITRVIESTGLIASKKGRCDE